MRTRMLIWGDLMLVFGMVLVTGCESGDAPGAGWEKTSHANTILFSRPTTGRAGAWSNHIAVPVSIDGGPTMAFLVDTGSPVTTLLMPLEFLSVPSVAARFKQPGQTTVQTLGGSTAAYRVQAASVTVGTARVAPF